MTRVSLPASFAGGSSNETADNMVRFLLRRMAEEPAVWSAGLALSCFAPPMSAALQSEVHRRLSAHLMK